MSFLKRASDFFYNGDTFDRVTFGLDRYLGGRWLIFWRITDLVYLAILFVLFPLVGRIQPFQRQFSLNDITIQHPFAERERVNASELFLYCTVVPLAVVGVLSLVFSKPGTRIYTAYVSLLGILLSVFSTSIITDILKNFFGRHRPDFLARCIPAPGTPKDVLVYAKDVCTTKNIGRLMDGFRTTPLGHSSLSFAGLLFTSLWLAGQLQVTQPQVGAWRWAVSFIPVFCASLIALSRTEDYRHHFIDVFVGLVLGSCVAIWLYFRLFPCLRNKLSYQPVLLLLSEETESDYDPINAV